MVEEILFAFFCFLLVEKNATCRRLQAENGTTNDASTVDLNNLGTCQPRCQSHQDKESMYFFALSSAPPNISSSLFRHPFCYWKKSAWTFVCIANKLLSYDNRMKSILENSSAGSKYHVNKNFFGSIASKTFCHVMPLHPRGSKICLCSPID